MTESIPQLDDHLPDLLQFVRTLARQIEAGELSDGDALAQRCRDSSVSVAALVLVINHANPVLHGALLIRSLGHLALVVEGASRQACYLQ